VPSVDANQFGVRLRDLRKKAGLTQRELAEKVGVDFTYLSKIESGAMPPPSEKVIILLAEALNANKDELLFLAGKIPSDIAQLLTNRPTVALLKSIQRGQKMIKASNEKRQDVQVATSGFFKTHRNFLKPAVAIALVAAITTSLWFAVPTKAVEVSLPSLPTTMNTNSSYTFYAQVDINTDESIPATSLHLSITGPTNAFVDFAIDGTITSQSSQFTSITPLVIPYYASTDRYAYGYGYQPPPGVGYGYFSSTWGVGLGYGYGYGGGLTTQAKYQITLNTTNMSTGTYEAQLSVNVTPAPTRFLSPQYTFTITTAPAGGGATPTPTPTATTSPTAQELATMPTEQAAQTVIGMSTQAAATTMTEVATKSIQTAGAIMTEVATQSVQTAGAIMTEVATQSVQTAGAIMTEVATQSVQTAAAIMDQIAAVTLNTIIPAMSAEALVTTLPEVSLTTLYSLDIGVLIEAIGDLVNVECMADETPPQPQVGATAPVTLYVTPMGTKYLVVETSEGWFYAVATPPPLQNVMIKTKEAANNIETLVEVSAQQPSGMTTPLPAGQIVRAYVTITIKNLTAENIELAYMTFKLEKEWLERNAIHKWGVALHRYDSETGQWVEMPTKRIAEVDFTEYGITDSDANLYYYYSAVLTQFSTFAISGNPNLSPPSLKSANITISPAEAKVGQAVTISADITNTSDASGKFPVTLWLNKVATAGAEVSLQAGETTSVSFIIMPDAAGTYDVRLIQSLSSLTVTEAGVTPTPTTPTPTTPTPTTVPPTPTNWALIGGIIAAVVVIVVVTVIIRRRRAA
jgi:PGF-pre-PGF domain-containing protein